MQSIQDKGVNGPFHALRPLFTAAYKFTAVNSTNTPKHAIAKCRSTEPSLFRIEMKLTINIMIDASKPYLLSQSNKSFAPLR